VVEESSRSPTGAAAVPLKAQMEEELWAKVYNVLLYANPGITAFSSALSGPATTDPVRLDVERRDLDQVPELS